MTLLLNVTAHRGVSHFVVLCPEGSGVEPILHPNTRK